MVDKKRNHLILRLTAFSLGFLFLIIIILQEMICPSLPAISFRVPLLNLSVRISPFAEVMILTILILRLTNVEQVVKKYKFKYLNAVFETIIAVVFIVPFLMAFTSDRYSEREMATLSLTLSLLFMLIYFLFQAVATLLNEVRKKR